MKLQALVDIKMVSKTIFAGDVFEANEKSSKVLIYVKKAVEFIEDISPVKDFTVVILSNNARNLNRCVDSIRYNDEECRIVVVADDGLTERRKDCDYVDGQRPFVFSRNANIGINQVKTEGFFLMNDDATLETELGFSVLADNNQDRYGAISPAIRENVGNPDQRPKACNSIRGTKERLAFVCVFMTIKVYHAVGPLDERFIGYGCEDTDYCKRITLLGLSMGVFDRCIVGHTGRSEFKGSDNYPALVKLNQKLLSDKQKLVNQKIRVLVAAFAYNEKPYLPEMVEYYRGQECELLILDNYSTDGTYEWLLENGVRTRQVDTKGAFHLDILQEELLKDIREINPDWVIYTDVDTYFLFKTSIKETISSAEQKGNSIIQARRFDILNTGEKFGLPLQDHFFHAEQRNPLRRVYKHDDTVVFKAEWLQRTGAGILQEGIVLNYGFCKPKKEKEEKLKRRKKAWKMGLNKNYGCHLVEAKERKWKWDEESLVDLRGDEFFPETRKFFKEGKDNAAVDILFLSHERKEFTLKSFESLANNTNWDLVNRLYIYDDMSKGGLYKALCSRAKQLPVKCRVLQTKIGHPVVAMKMFFAESDADFYCKIDNDVMLPPRWLDVCLEVMKNHNELDILGLEAVTPRSDKPYTYSYSSSVGGIGLIRSTIEGLEELTFDSKYSGWTEWQINRPEIVRGWIDPPIPVCLLDRMTIDPWIGLSQKYVTKDWQRPWKMYTEEDSWLWEWWI